MYKIVLPLEIIVVAMLVAIVVATLRTRMLPKLGCTVEQVKEGRMR